MIRKRQHHWHEAFTRYAQVVGLRGSPVAKRSSFRPHPKRRRTARTRTRGRVLLGDSKVTARLRDLSRQGMGVQLLEPLRDRVIRVEVSIGQQTVNAIARVVWERGRNAGLEFIDPNPNLRRALDGFFTAA